MLFYYLDSIAKIQLWSLSSKSFLFAGGDSHTQPSLTPRPRPPTRCPPSCLSPTPPCGSHSQGSDTFSSDIQLQFSAWVSFSFLMYFPCHRRSLRSHTSESLRENIRSSVPSPPYDIISFTLVSFPPYGLWTENWEMRTGWRVHDHVCVLTKNITGTVMSIGAQTLYFYPGASETLL